MSLISPAPAGCSRRAATSTRNSRRTTRTRSLRSSNCPAGVGIGNFSVGPDKMNRPCRVYAPVGGHEDLLAYLVRRLLENGANTSFVNRIVDERAPIDEIAADPVARLAALPHKAHPKIPLPHDLFLPERRNSQGIDLADPRALANLRAGLADALQRPAHAAPIIGGREAAGTETPVFDPSDRGRQVGAVIAATPEAIQQALARAA